MCSLGLSWITYRQKLVLRTNINLFLLPTRPRRRNIVIQKSYSTHHLNRRAGLPITFLPLVPSCSPSSFFLSFFWSDPLKNFLNVAFNFERDDIFVYLSCFIQWSVVNWWTVECYLFVYYCIIVSFYNKKVFTFLLIKSFEYCL